MLQNLSKENGHRARAPRRQQRLTATSACCLNDQYDALTTPMPRHLAALVDQLEMQK